jgi:iron complex transport system substrate-binding protein
VLLTQALCDVCAVSEADVCALAATLDGASVATLGGTTLDGVCDDVARVAAAIGRVRDGERLVASVQARLRIVDERTATSDRRPSVAVIEWTDPVFLAGHWGPEMVRRAGGDAVIGREGAHSAVVALDALAAADPRIVIVAPCGYDLRRSTDEARRLLDDPTWRWLRGREVWALDANALLSRPGPRLVDGIEALAAIVQPSAGAAPRPEHATRLA